MRCRQLLSLLCGLWLYASAKAQPLPANIPLQTLLHSNKSVPVVWHHKAITLSDSPFHTFSQNLLKTHDGLYVFINGSGRIYQLHDEGTGIFAKRIDSTVFFGYNFNSYPFVYRDTIYSLGGYGLWRTNGQLRAFIPQANSWNIVPLNEEVPVMMQDNRNNMLWYDKPNGKLYVASCIYRNEAVKPTSASEANFDFRVRCLDLAAKEWKILGTLNEFFRERISLVRSIAHTPWGQLAAFGENLVLIDYAGNRMLRLTDEAQSKIRPQLFELSTTNLFYFADSVLYFGNVEENRLQSLVLKKSDFTPSDVKVYTVDTPGGAVLMPVMAGVFVLLGAAGAYAWQKSRKNTGKAKPPAATLPPLMPPAIADEEAKTAAKRETGNPPPAENEETPKPHQYFFNDKERLVLQLIAANSSNGKATSIEEMNAVLGLSKKNSDIQKSQRSQLLKSINKSYRIWQHTEEELVQSRPAQNDRRSKEYFIAAGKLLRLKEWFG